MTYENEISVEAYMRLRAEAKWGAISYEQAEIGLKNSAFLIACKDKNEYVGTARVLYDGGYAAYLCDVMVSPDYQGMGIGKYMVSKIIDYLKSQLKPGWKIMLSLESAKGKEGFYKKLGLTERPNETLGHGMSMWLTNTSLD